MTNYQTINLQAVAAVVVANWFLFLRYLPANFATTRYLQCLNECSFLAATHAFTLFENDDNDDWVTREPHNSSRTLISCHIDPESEFEITPTASVNCYLCSTVCRSFLARKCVYVLLGTYILDFNCINSIVVLVMGSLRRKSWVGMECL